MNTEETLRAYKERLEAYLDAMPISGAPDQLRLPVDDSFTDDGSALRVDDWQKNIDAFRMFAYE